MNDEEISRLNYIIFKAVKCGFIEGFSVGSRANFLDYILPSWVHRLIFKIQCKFDKNLYYDMCSVLEELHFSGKDRPESD